MPNTAPDHEQQSADPWRGTLEELERLQDEIDNDLTAGRLSPEAYQSANERIAIALKAATEPLPQADGRKLRVVGIPRKAIDTEKLAMVYWMQAKRLAREKREGMRESRHD